MVEQGRMFSIMNPDELNIELRTLYDFLPNIEFPGSVEGDSPIGSEEWIKELEVLSDRIDQRENSELKQRLTQRYRKLIAFAQTTDSCKDFLVFEYGELFSSGIDKKPLIGISEIEYWARIFKWREPDNGGIFDGEKALEIERQLLKDIQKRELVSKTIFEIAMESGDFQKLLDQIKTASIEDGQVRRMLMSEEELIEYKQQVEKGNKAAKETMEKEAYSESLLQRWHSDFLTKYGDEP